ncbi:MAG: Yip1 family protein [Candidatus Micrarchaeia archaeon]|jgi:hypothetical protein
MLEWIKENAELCVKSSELVARKKGQGGIKEGAKFILISSFIVAAIQAVLQLALFGSFAAAGGSGLLVFGGLYGLFLIIAVPIMSIIIAFILQGIIYAIARMLGGKGSFADQFYLMAIPTSVMTLSAILQLAPCVGALAVLAIALYLLFVEIVIIRDLHQISVLKAAFATLAIPLVITIVIVLAALLYLGVFNAPSYNPATGAATSGGGIFDLQERIPDQCRFKVGLMCTSAGISASEGIKLNLQNTIGSKISVCQIRCSGATTDTGAIIGQAVQACDGGGLGSMGPGVQAKFNDQSPDAMGCLKDENDVSGPYYTNVGDRVRGKLYLWYSEQGEGTTGNARLAVGDLQTTISP